MPNFASPSLNLDLEALHLFLRRLRDPGIVLHIVESNLCRSLRNRHSIDLVLKPHQSIEESFRARRTPGYIDVHRYHVIDTLKDGVGIERSPDVRAGAIDITHFGSGIWS